MKLICAIALVFGLLMFREGIVLGVITALFFALAFRWRSPFLMSFPRWWGEELRSSSKALRGWEAFKAAREAMREGGA